MRVTTRFFTISASWDWVDYLTLLFCLTVDERCWPEATVIVSFQQISWGTPHAILYIILNFENLSLPFTSSRQMVNPINCFSIVQLPQNADRFSLLCMSDPLLLHTFYPFTLHTVCLVFLILRFIVGVTHLPIHRWSAKIRTKEERRWATWGLKIQLQ
jgi:hypothetical protein